MFEEFTIPTPNSGPRGIIAGPAGGYWFTEFNAGKIGFITTAGVITEYTIPTPNSGPVGHRLAHRPAAVVHREQRGKVGSITLGGVITEYNVPSGPGLGRICTGYDGFDFVDMWFVESNADKVAKIAANGDGHRVQPPGRRLPLRHQLRLRRRVYVAEAGANLIARVNPVGVVIEFAPPTPNSQPFSIAQGGGPNSKIWFTERGAAKIGAMTFP